MKVLIVLTILAYASASFFAIDELKKMVPSYADRAQLEVLDKDQYTARSQIQQQINDIVRRQTQDIQVRKLSNFNYSGVQKRFSRYFFFGKQRI